MKITCLTHTRWEKPSVQDPEELFSSNNRKRIVSTLRKVGPCNVRTEMKPLDQEFLDWFTPFYAEHIGKKDNAHIYDLYSATLGRKNSPSEYWSFKLFQNDIPLGGTIVGIREDLLVIAFKAYLSSWLEGKIQAKPSLYADHQLAKHGFENSKSTISHGRDRNPYGLNSSIGLATYKLSSGFIPKRPNAEDTVEIETSNLEVDVLIMLPPESGELITKAKLFCTPETEEKYKQLLGYSNVLDFEVLYRNSVS